MRELEIYDVYESAKLYENGKLIEVYNDKPSVDIAVKENEKANGMTIYVTTYNYYDRRKHLYLTPYQANRIYSTKQIEELCKQGLLEKQIDNTGKHCDTFRNLSARLKHDGKAYESELYKSGCKVKPEKYSIMLKIIGAVKYASITGETWEYENNKIEMNERISDYSSSLLDEIYDFFVKKGYSKEPFEEDMITYGLKILMDFANLQLQRYSY